MTESNPSVSKYYGPDEIESLEISKEKTSGGEQVMSVKLKGITDKFLIPADVLARCTTTEKSDFTKLREAKVVPVAEKILEAMLEAHFKLEDFDYLIMKVKASIDMAADSAQKVLWGKDRNELTIADIDKILKK